MKPIEGLTTLTRYAFGLGLSAVLLSDYAYALRRAPSPEPEDKTKLATQLERYRGQTEFLNASRMFNRGMQPQAAGLEGGDAKFGAAPGAARTEQESDVFKISSNGSKLVYLLNSYRGLQIVSFKNGLEKPELIGRVESTGNWAEDMYLDEKNSRIFVLERYWYDPSNPYGYERNSRLIVYNVKNPAKPEMEKSITIPGELSDHRMVGDVLYVATSEWNNNNRWNFGMDGGGQQNLATGNVISYQLTADGIKQVDQVKLSRPVSDRGNMSIQRAGEKYYLVAVLKESRWSWNEQRSYVELVDITDPAGKIVPTMVVNPRGFIVKRSQVIIKNNTVVTVSNYTPKVPNAVQRIAVESFNLPDQVKVRFIGEEEARFRAQWIDYQVNKAGQEVEKREVAYQKAVADEEKGLSDVYVISKEENSPNRGRMQKWVADRSIITKDLRNQNTTIFDVRASKDFLYVFWFPGSQDPLEVFTFDKPEEKIEHLVHQEFNGFVSRSFPVRFNNKEYIIGLGFAPVEGKEAWVRRPQAILFEIIQAGELAAAKPISQIELSDESLWSNFGGQDKMTELRFDGNDPSKGKGYILFEAHGVIKGKYRSGGKLVRFDLSKAKTKDVFTSGAFLAGNANWLKRVFTNAEVEAINTFSNEALATYGMDATQKADKDLVTAISVLELARNVRAFIATEKNGYQLITETDYESQEQGKIVLRSVKADGFDAEKGESSGEVVIAKGNMSDFVLSQKRDSLLLLSTVSRHEKKEVPGKETVYEYYTDFTVTQVSLKGEKPEVVGTPAKWTDSQNVGRGFGGGRMPGMWRPYMPVSFTRADNTLFVQGGAAIKKISSTAKEVTAEAIDVGACVKVDQETLGSSVQIIDGKFYAISNESVKTPQEGMLYQRNYFAKGKLNGNKLECGEKVNIPGTPIAVYDNQVVTNDDRLLYFEKYEGADKKVHLQPITKQNLVSLKLEEKKATLADTYEEDNSYDFTHPRLLGRNLLFVSNKQQQNNWGGMRSGVSPVEFVQLGFDSELRFTSRTHVAKLPGSHWSISQILPQEKGYLMLLSNGALSSVASWDSKAGLEPRQVSPVAVDGTKGKPVSYFRTNSYYGYWGYQNPALGSAIQQNAKYLDFAEGMFGVKRLSLE